MLDTFTIATFIDRLGSAFRIHTADAQHMTVELIDVADLTSRGGRHALGRERVPFSIVFRGPRGTVLPQHIYRMEHDEIGTFDLFLVPIGPDGQGMRYEAVFT